MNLLQMKILFTEYCLLSFCRNIPLNFAIECVRFYCVVQFCNYSIGPEETGSHRTGEMGRTAGRGLLGAQVFSVQVFSTAISWEPRVPQPRNFVVGPLGDIHLYIFSKTNAIFKKDTQIHRMITYNPIPREKLLMYFCIYIFRHMYVIFAYAFIKILSLIL